MNRPVAVALIALINFACVSYASAHANACHRAYLTKEDTIEFYGKSFKASEILHVDLLKARMAADNFLELGVLADVKGQTAEAEKYLNKAFASMKESRKYMDDLYEQIGELRKHDRTHAPLPEHIRALGKILKDQPPVERVSLTNSRFANVSQGKELKIHTGSFGTNFDELLANLQSDLKILQKETDEVIEAFLPVLPLAKDGGFAAVVLSGRAPLPEKIMHSVDQTLVYAQYFNRGCMASIAADMQVYPKGFEWLPKVNWKR